MAQPGVGLLRQHLRRDARALRRLDGRRLGGLHVGGNGREGRGHRTRAQRRLARRRVLHRVDDRRLLRRDQPLRRCDPGRPVPPPPLCGSPVPPLRAAPRAPLPPGAIVDNFTRIKKETDGSASMTPEQKQWADSMRASLAGSARAPREPSHPLRRRCFRLVPNPNPNPNPNTNPNPNPDPNPNPNPHPNPHPNPDPDPRCARAPSSTL